MILAGVLLVLGLWQPILSVERFFVFSNPFSIMESLVALFDSEEYFLFAVIFCFTVAFPTAKLVWAVYLWAGVDVDSPAFDRTVDLLDTLGKWSMLDVMLLAVAVASIKFSLVGDAHANPGLYLFCAAIISAMAASRWIKSAGRRLSA